MGSSPGGEEEIILLEASGSDDEEFNKLGISQKSTWYPKLEEIEKLYKFVKNNKTIDLEWKCTGRRDPSTLGGMVENVSEMETNMLSSNFVKDSESDDFTFDEEVQATESLKGSKTGHIFKTKASTKRTTTLAGILSNMERHRIIDRHHHLSPPPPT